MTRQIRRQTPCDHLDEIYAERNSVASNTCLRHFAPACSLLQTRRTIDRVYPLHAVVDSKLKFHPHARSRTHTCPFCFLVSLSLFSPLSFSFSFFFFFNFVHSILDTGRGEDMRVPPCRDIGLFSKSSPPPPTTAILSNMKFLTPRVRVFDHAPPG